MPNKFGKYTKEEVKKLGLPIFEEGFTYSDLRKMGYKLSDKERLELAIGFRTGKGWRGYVLVYDVFEILRYFQDKANQTE